MSLRPEEAQTYEMLYCMMRRLKAWHRCLLWSEALHHFIGTSLLCRGQQALQGLDCIRCEAVLHQVALVQETDSR